MWSMFGFPAHIWYMTTGEEKSWLIFQLDWRKLLFSICRHKKVDPTEWRFWRFWQFCRFWRFWRFWRTRENVKMPVTGVTGGSETFQEGSHQGWQSDKERQVMKQRQMSYEKWQNVCLGWERVKRSVGWGTWLGSTLQLQRRRVGAKIADWRSWMAVLPLWL